MFLVRSDGIRDKLDCPPFGFEGRSGKAGKKPALHFFPSVHSFHNQELQRGRPAGFQCKHHNISRNQAHLLFQRLKDRNLDKHVFNNLLN